MQMTRLLTVIEEETEFHILAEKVKGFFFPPGADSRMTSLRVFITALLVGVFAFIVVFAVKKRAAKRFVDAVISAQAHTGETAKTLAELGLAGDRGVVRALRGGALSRMTSTVEGDKYAAQNFGKSEVDNALDTPESQALDQNAASPDNFRENDGKKPVKQKISAPIYKANPEKDRFYLAENKALSLASIYGGKMGTAGTIVLSAAFCIALWFALDAAVPFFISLLGSSWGK